jgi:hypothetical protein
MAEADNVRASMAPASDSPIFIVGCPRSGTSLLRDLLRAHPRLTFPEESHFIPSLYRAYGDPGNEREARELAARILATGWVKAWGLTLDASAFAADRSFARIVARVYEAWAERQQKPRWGDKTPSYVREIPLLLKLFPAAKILHIYRDGRDVALSWLRYGIGPRNLYTAARMWSDTVRAGRRAGAAAGPERYLEVRYEALLADPAAVMRAVCAFLDEPFTDAVLRPHAFAGEGAKGPVQLHYFFIGKPRGPRPRQKEIVAENAGKWKREMTPAGKILFESAAGDLLRELGYETEGRVRTIAPPERWLWKTHHRLSWMLSRLNRKDYYREVMEALGKHAAILARRARSGRS